MTARMVQISPTNTPYPRRGNTHRVFYAIDTNILLISSEYPSILIGHNGRGSNFVREFSNFTHNIAFQITNCGSNYLSVSSEFL